MRRLTCWLLAGILCATLGTSVSAIADANSESSPLAAPAIVQLPSAQTCAVVSGVAASVASEDSIDATDPSELDALPVPNRLEMPAVLGESDAVFVSGKADNNTAPDKGIAPAVKDETKVVADVVEVLPACCLPGSKAQKLGSVKVNKATAAIAKAKQAPAKNGKVKQPTLGKAKQPANKMMATNTGKVATSHKSPAPPAGVGKKIQVKAYAYCINGRTASGTRTALGTVAVDPRLIPLGSKVYIPGYGWGTALDTGGHMRGSVIDIWYPSYGQCMQWGSRNVTITVMPK